MRLVRPLIRQDGISVSKAIKNLWIYKFGKSKAILSDRGKVFEGEEMKALSAKFGIQQELPHRMNILRMAWPREQFVLYGTC